MESTLVAKNSLWVSASIFSNNDCYLLYFLHIADIGMTLYFFTYLELFTERRVFDVLIVT